ncbi:biotin--[acetyl-CoA-carboxylase] ligase [Aquimarina sp. I32.4]|uniref:biotin--[acetyl-CoA-carboxylase] ligase n=1 Tax=Aquimarina sp. I32.4 TaxID=2053903 RepID=UPI000CDE97E8|nr:biotin--[acetyl-CoA-carboxylase] ligase [Aquimarina sp. I32.4]
MHIIKVDAIDSTNIFLRELIRKKKQVDPICVLAREQLAGKGQMGTVWQSNPGQNLTCSVFIPIQGVPLADQFFISMVTSLAVYDTLRSMMITKLSVKWPNDILSDRQKLCGILIENVVKNGSMIGAVIGVGVNVNQTNFDNLPQAGSLKQILGYNLEVEEVLNSLLQRLQKRFLELVASNYHSIKKEYEEVLFRKNKPSAFMNAKGESFVGIIKSVTNEGKLQVLIEDDIISDFDLKEVKLLY